MRSIETVEAQHRKHESVTNLRSLVANLAVMFRFYEVKMPR